MAGYRRLPLVPTPIEGEWFASWVDALGTRLLLPGSARFAALGIELAGNRQSVFSKLHHLDREEIEVVAATSGLDDVEVTEMLMIPFYGAAIPNGPGISDPSLVRRWLNVHRLGRRRVAACPSCLRDTGGRWQASWRLPQSVICLRHREYLIAQCPRRECRRPLHYPSTRREFHPELRRSVGDSQRNWAVRILDVEVIEAAGLREPEQWCQPIRNNVGHEYCLTPHITVVSRPARDEALLSIQRLMDEFCRMPTTAVMIWFIDVRETLQRSAQSPYRLRHDASGPLMQPDEFVMETMNELVDAAEAQPQKGRAVHWLAGRRRADEVVSGADSTAALLRAGVEREGLGSVLGVLLCD